MMYLVGHLFGALVLAAVLSAFLGWWWHLYRSRRETQIAEAERARLRAELVRRARAAQQRPRLDDPDGQDELAFLRQAAERQAARVADLERQVAEARGEADRLRAELRQARDAVDTPDFALENVTELNNRVAELELELDDARAELARATADRGPSQLVALEEELQAMRAQAADAGALRVELAAAQTQLRALAKEAPDREEAQLKSWRLAYFEARAAELEALLEAARNRPSPPALAAAPPPPALPPTGDDELNVLRWRNRYLAARTAYLEGRHAEYREEREQAAALAAAEAPRNEEAERRSAWRLAYLDRRLGWVIERSRETVAAADDEVTGLERQLQIVRAALETASGDVEKAREARAQAEAEVEALRKALDEAKATPSEPEEARRLRWRASYLEQRVRQLEDDALASVSVATAAPAAAEEEAPTPPEPATQLAPSVVLAAPEPPPPAPLIVAPPPPARQPTLADRPPRLGAPRNGAPDDLRLIQGVTPQIESKLNASGIYHFDQIADWTLEQASWVDNYLALKGQIEAEGWIAQARRLADGDLPPPRPRYSVEAERL